MMKNKEITIVIPTYTNTPGLRKLVAWFKNKDYLVVVVDNNPNENKKNLLNKKFITYLPQSKNTGFAAAVNLASKKIQTPWFVILNDDVELMEKNPFPKLLEYAKENNLSVVSPVLKNINSMVENLGYRVMPIGRVELNFDKDKKIDGLTAACLLINTKLFEKVHGFDERFFAYLEDVDLFLRLKKLGEGFGVCLNTEVIHNHMSTSSKMGNFKQKQDLKNWILVIIKHWDRRTLLRYLPQIMVERFRNLSGFLKVYIKSGSVIGIIVLKLFL